MGRGGKKIPSLEVATSWDTKTGESGWDSESHPWMMGYCAYFAKALIEQNPAMTYAIEYEISEEGEVAEHVYAYDGEFYYDARGRHREVRDDEECYTITGCSEEDVRREGLFSPAGKLRRASEKDILSQAEAFIQKRRADWD